MNARVLSAAVILCSFLSATKAHAEVLDTVLVDGIRYELNLFNNKYTASVLSADDDVYNPDCKRYSGIVTINPYVRYNDVDYKVTSVWNYAFYKCADLEEIILPNTITDIYSYAFAECGDLKLELPSSVEGIGNQAFMNTNFFPPLDFRNVKHFDLYAFEGVTFNEVTLGADLEGLRSMSFTKSPIEKLIFEESENISDKYLYLYVYTFYRSNLHELQLPERRLFFSNYVCAEMPNLERVILPDVKKIRYKYDVYSYQAELMIPYFTSERGEEIITKCPRLKEIVSLAATPPQFYYTTYNFSTKKEEERSIEPPIIDDHSQYVLKVPQGSEELYRADPVWGRFERIEGFAPGEYTGISEAPVTDFESEAAPVYYNLQGMQVKEPVKGQLYIRRTGAKTAKIVY